MNPRLTAIKNKVIGKTSDILSGPKRAYYGMKQSQSDSDVNILKTARQLKGQPKFTPGVGPTDAFKYQSVAEGIKSRRMK